MSANIKASTDGTQAIIGVGGVDQMTVSNAGVVTANSFVGAISDTNVTATGSTTQRTLANRFADVINVKDFGAVGDWNSTTGTDNFTAFQNAIVSMGTRGGTLYVPNGRYLCNGTITLTDNINILGDGSYEINGSTQIIFGNTTGPCFRIKGSFCSLKGMNLAATNARRTNPVGRITASNYASLGLTRDDQNFGIWAEPNDASGAGNIQGLVIEDVWVHNQPSDGIVLSTRTYLPQINGGGVRASNGHCITITNGTYTGRTFDTGIVIGLNMSNSSIHSSEGHGILAGTPFENVPPGRLIFENVDCYGCGQDTTIMYPDTNGDYYIHFLYCDQSVIRNSACGGQDVLGNILCGGRQIELNNNRYLSTVQPIRIEGNLGSSVRSTQGVKIFGLSVFSAITITNAVSIGSNADNIEVYAAVAGGYTNPATLGLASIVYDIDKTIFNESVLFGKTVDDDNTVGSRIASGVISATRSGNVPGILNRNTSDGNILLFRSEGLAKGQIYINSSSVRYYTTTTAFLTSGTGSPSGNVSAPPGSLYTNLNGGAGATLFVKESGSGNTGWIAK